MKGKIAVYNIIYYYTYIYYTTLHIYSPTFSQFITINYKLIKSAQQC